MPVCTCVVGLQWGDEAKGKIVDLLAEDHDVIVRYNGGANAGHTVVANGKTFKLSLLPTGVLRPGKLAVIANGVVVHPAKFLEESEGLRKAGVAISGENLVVSNRAHVILPYHVEEEAVRERQASQPIGTTQRGIGPCYQDKAGRSHAIRVGDLVQPQKLRERLRQIVPHKNKILQAMSPEAKTFDASAIADEYEAFGKALAPHVRDTMQLLNDSYRQGKRIIFEAAQGSLLDVDHGTYPFVTSSNSSSAGTWNGSGLSARYLTRVVGVLKAYTTRVGAGPFPTELNDDVGEKIRRTGKEYGTVTGRPRRCGWFDAVAAKYAATLSGADELAVMLLDVLSDFDEIAICTHYQCDGKRTDHFPADADEISRCVPVYERLPGWKSDVSTARKPADLPKPARTYLDRLSSLIGLPVATVSVGPDRVQTIPMR